MPVTPSAPTRRVLPGRWTANGGAVRAIRLAQGLQQVDVAAAANINPSWLSKIESGRAVRGNSRVNVQAGNVHLVKLAEVLNVPVEVLTGQLPAIEILRNLQGIDARQFATDVGVTTLRLRRLEQGSEIPDPELAAVLARRLGVDPEVIRPADLIAGAE